MRMKTYAKAEDRSWWKPFQVSVAEMTRDDPLARQIEHFGRVARGEARPIVSARDGLQNLRITEAIAEAARTGSIVDTTPV
jgi:predicted dehydrogenase